MTPPVFVEVPVSVTVPATSANLGPGFDCLGLALQLHDDLTVELRQQRGCSVEVTGEGEGLLPSDEHHLVAAVMLRTFDVLGGRPPGFLLSAHNRVPHGRGLGSSAAAIVAGAVLARACVVDGQRRLPEPALLDLVADVEGHPDNVAAALLGGLTIAWTERASAGQRHRAIRLDPDATLEPVAFVPDGALATKAARALLPATVPHADAAFNAGRAALLVTALRGRPDLLLAATDDRLHQPYRATAMPESAALLATLRADGVPAVVSGAGPTVLALCPPGTGQAVAGRAAAGFRAIRLAPDPSGAQVRLGG